MEIGIDSFAKKTQTNEGGNVLDDAHAMSELIERIEHADKVGLDVFGIGEHHREEFLDSAAHNILSAAASRTKNKGKASVKDPLPATISARPLEIKSKVA